MLSDHDLMNVQSAIESIPNPVTLLFNRGAEQDPFETNLLNLARQISGVSMNRIMLEEGGFSLAFPGKPSLTLAAGDFRNIHYLAAPEGRELAPFLEAVAWLGEGKPRPTIRSLGDFNGSVKLLLLMAEACPHCPRAVQAALSVAVNRPSVELHIVDAIQFPDVAERYRVRSTPTTIVDGALTIVGELSAEQLAGHLVRGKDPQWLTVALDSMIKSGRAEDAGELICTENRPEAVLPIYKAKEFSVRMGALVAMDEALERNPRALDSIVDDLAALLEQDDIALRGDTAELLGRIGNPAAIPALRKAAKDPDPDVRDAVEEALEILESQGAGE